MAEKGKRRKGSRRIADQLRKLGVRVELSALFPKDFGEAPEVRVRLREVSRARPFSRYTLHGVSGEGALLHLGEADEWRIHIRLPRRADAIDLLSARAMEEALADSETTSTTEAIRKRGREKLTVRAGEPFFLVRWDARGNGTHLFCGALFPKPNADRPWDTADLALHLIRAEREEAA